MHTHKSLKLYVAVIERTDAHQDVQIFRTLFATVDTHRLFNEIFVSNNWKNCQVFVLVIILE